MVIHKYEKYDAEKKKYTSIAYTDIAEIALALDSNESMLFRLVCFLKFFLTPDSIDKAVYILMDTYDAETEGNSYGIQCYKASSIFLKCISLILWVMLFIPYLVLILLDEYMN